MYFPSDMNFQYFFFSTYPGFFLQALPIALIAGAIYVIHRTKQTPKISTGRAVLSSIFVCYFVGLLCLTLFNSIIGDIYYYLFYHAPSGRWHNWFTFEYDFVPDFFINFGSENLGNILMYLPFGILYPLFSRRATWKRSIFAGIITSVAIELVQPIFGRSFDINDVILNGIGVIISTTIYFTLKTTLQRKR